MEFSMKHTNKLLGILHSWKPPISFISPTVNQAIVMVTDWSVLRLVCYCNKNVFTSGNPKDFHDRSSWDVHFFWTRKHRNANAHSHMWTMVLVYAQMHDWVINSSGFYVGVHIPAFIGTLGPRVWLAWFHIFGDAMSQYLIATLANGKKRWYSFQKMEQILYIDVYCTYKYHCLVLIGPFGNSWHLGFRAVFSCRCFLRRDEFERRWCQQWPWLYGGEGTLTAIWTWFLGYIKTLFSDKLVDFEPGALMGRWTI